MFEKGLISVDNRRLSLEEYEIKRKFRISKDILAELVNSRLLRSEPRVGSIYYELSHDTMIAPIRQSQKKHKSKLSKIWWYYGVRVKEFINNNQKLPQEQTKLLLQLIDILESPKAEGDKKIKEPEKSIPAIFK
ncbi:MAG: hypothetical protein PVH61_32750 [Candidatus Aminicenantes bacterium]